MLRSSRLCFIVHTKVIKNLQNLVTMTLIVVFNVQEGFNIARDIIAAILLFSS